MENGSHGACEENEETVEYEEPESEDATVPKEFQQPVKEGSPSLDKDKDQRRLWYTTAGTYLTMWRTVVTQWKDFKLNVFYDIYMRRWLCFSQEIQNSGFL